MKTVDLNKMRKSPTMSTKSIGSYKYTNHNKRRESASENEIGLKRKNGYLR
jgi:hypothetical protein